MSALVASIVLDAESRAVVVGRYRSQPWFCQGKCSQTCALVKGIEFHKEN